MSPDYQNPLLGQALTNFIAALGARYDGDPRIEENVSIGMIVKSEAFSTLDSSFSAVDGADLPNKIALRQDFEIKNTSYILRLVCKRN